MAKKLSNSFQHVKVTITSNKPPFILSLPLLALPYIPEYHAPAFAAFFHGSSSWLLQIAQLLLGLDGTRRFSITMPNKALYEQLKEKTS